MNDVSKPPPYVTAAAAAGGAFIGALAGVIVATSMMGDPNDSEAQSAADKAGTDQPVVVAER